MANLDYTAGLSVTASRALVDQHMREDLSAFTYRAFEIVAPGEEMLPNWHIDAITYRLDQVRRKKVKRLMITMPPRYFKSTSTSIAFPAFLLGHDPTVKIITVSYSEILAKKHHNDCRTIMRSDFYRRIFPGTRISDEKDTETEFMTTQRGGRFTTSVGGTLTGRGANLIIIDDPMQPEDACSASGRRRVLQWFETTLLSRLNNKMEDAIIIVTQRLHEDDLAGALLKKGGWDSLDLQAIAESEQDIPIGPNKVVHRSQGEVLHPAREPRDVLDAMKADMGTFDFSAQYQQRPIPLQGNLIRRDWIKHYTAVPARQPGDTIVISWDTASKASELANYSVATVWLLQGDNCYLLDLIRERYDFPELKQVALQLIDRWPGASVLIEDKGSGTSLIQELRANRRSVIAINPDSDKVTRLYSVQPKFESGSVLLPKGAAWLPDLLEELLAFPKFCSDDQVDSISQALAWASRRRQNYQQMEIGVASVWQPNEWRVGGADDSSGSSSTDLDLWC
jgi:predicted phage terminase large subunit-like protein